MLPGRCNAYAADKTSVTFWLDQFSLPVTGVRVTKNIAAALGALTGLLTCSWSG